MNVLISYNSDSISEVNYLNDQLKPFDFNIYLINESDPSQISIRCNLVKKCDSFIVITSRGFQKNNFCMELVNYAKDLKKPIFVFNKKISFRPFGALGAIIVGCAQNEIIEFENKEKFQTNFNKIVHSLNELKHSLKQTEQIEINRPSTPSISLSFATNNKEIDVLVSHHSDTKQIADIIEQGLKANNLLYSIEESTNGSSNVKNAKCIVIIMSAGYEQSYVCKSVVDTARLLNKQLIPVSVTRAWKPCDWLSLVLAGKLFFRIMDKSQAYKPIHDSNPMKDFIYEIIKTISPKPSISERDKTLIASLNKRIEDCKLKLSDWPPPKKIREKQMLKPVMIDLKTEKLETSSTNIHYTVTRLEFKQPNIVYDIYGIPLREKFDYMISYQWSKQQLVRDFFTDLHVRNFSAWFVIFKL